MGRILLRLITTLILLLLSHAPFMTLQQEDNPILRECGAAAGNYTSNSQFEANLVRSLLPSLASQAPLHSSTFYNTTVGQGSDRVYGFAQCMSASTAQECGACLNQSVAAVLGSCSFRRQAMVRYYNCILHYSDQPFLSQLDTNPRYTAWPLANASEPALFNQQLGILMRKLFSESASLPSRFAVGTINYTDLIDIYGVAQCTRDLSGSDCYICLDQAIMQISSCCMNRQGGNVYYPSCNIRYEVYAFKPAYGLSPPPPSSSPPPDHDAASPPTSSAASPPQSTAGIYIYVRVPHSSMFLSLIHMLMDVSLINISTPNTSHSTIVDSRLLLN